MKCLICLRFNLTLSGFYLCPTSLVFVMFYYKCGMETNNSKSNSLQHPWENCMLTNIWCITIRGHMFQKESCAILMLMLHVHVCNCSLLIGTYDQYKDTSNTIKSVWLIWLILKVFSSKWMLYNFTHSF